MCDNILQDMEERHISHTHRKEEETGYPNFTERREWTGRNITLKFHITNTTQEIEEKMLKDRAWHLLENEYKALEVIQDVCLTHSFVYNSMWAGRMSAIHLLR